MTLATRAMQGGEQVLARAGEEWQQLQRRLDETGPVPCQGDDADAWWPDVRSASAAAARRAVEACRRCPAAEECLAYALAADERFGIWGALLPEQRRQLQWASGGWERSWERS